MSTAAHAPNVLTTPCGADARRKRTPPCARTSASSLARRAP